MKARLEEVPLEVRRQVSRAIGERAADVAADLAGIIASEAELPPVDAAACGDAVLTLLTVAVDRGFLTAHDDEASGLGRCAPALTIRQLAYVAHRIERALLDELAVHDVLGATSQTWPTVAYSIRSAVLEVIASFSERETSRAAVYDPVTTLWSADVFKVGLRQEIVRAQRHAHGLAVLLFDVDDMARLNRIQGFGAGDRLLERLGILALRFFRTHDWVARVGGDTIAVLLPQTALDQAAALATRFREMVEQRIVLIDHKTEESAKVTVSAAAVGTDLVQSDLDPAYLLVEAEGALMRAKLNGGNRTERVALQPTSLTIVGAATLLGVSSRVVVTLIRSDHLKAVRRGRHFHIDRAAIEEYRSHR